MKFTVPLTLLATLICICCQLSATEIPPIKRVLPPEGLEIPVDVRERLETRLAATRERLAQRLYPGIFPDVEVFLKAVELAMKHREFYGPKDFEKADWALDEANKRLDWMDRGETPWKRETGLVVRGYRSMIDESVQPYGLVIPEDHDFKKPCPLYIWLHGRGDKNTDLHFLHERATKVGQIAPPGAIVLHPFGRHCVGYKHAGEVDVWEATGFVLRNYKEIDPNRLVLIGFSMGGAGAWHLGAHYTDGFIAVSPGAGFAETARYQRLTPDRYPPDYEQKLWGQYDVPGYVRNLFNTRVIAYSGELDKQIQAARVMEEAFKSEGRELEHLIGPGVEHKYEPKTLEELLGRLKTVAEKSDIQQFHQPDEVEFQTRTLRYPTQKWIRAEGLEEHWKDARIHGRRTGESVVLETKNITRLALTFPGHWKPVDVTIDGQSIGKAPRDKTDVPRTLHDEFVYGPVTAVKQAGNWLWTKVDESENSLRKQPGLQGPIDDAFMGRFLVVTPSRSSHSAAFQAWCDFEIAHFRDRWRALMRGEPRFKSDVEVTVADLANHQHLILWGDPQSNVVIQWLLKDTPIRYQDGGISLVGDWQFGGQSFDGRQFVPALVYPRKGADGVFRGYVVLNSGLTFREGHDRTNSLQNPKLPDWAIIDITQPPDAFAPGRIHDAGFFDEEWKLKGPVKGP
jgi:predicted esterase